jgi:hypothetical protein
MLTLNWYLYNSEFGDMQISGANLMDDKFIIRIIIIVVKVHNQLKIPHLNPVNKINTTLKNQ